MKSTIFSADSVSVSLESQMAQLALEAQFMQNVTDLFRNIVPSFKARLQQLHQQLTGFTQKDAVQDLIATYDSKAAYAHRFDKRTQTALDNAKHLDLLIFGEHIVTIPENFKGSLPVYATTLRQILETGLRHQSLLDTFNQQLSAFINNPEQRTSVTGNINFAESSNQGAVLKDYRDQSSKTLKTFFGKDTGISKAPLKNVLERFADLETLITQTQIMAHFLDVKILHSYQEKIQQMIQLLDIITEQYRKGVVTAVSPKTAMTLSQNVYDVAQYVEFIALLQYDGRVCLNVVDIIISGLAKPDEWKAANPRQSFDEPKQSKWFAGLQNLWQYVHQGA